MAAAAAAGGSWKVPTSLPISLQVQKNDFDDYYRPKVVSIGPAFYDYDAGPLHLVHRFKSTAVDLFIEGGHENRDFYLAKIAQLKDDITNFYEFYKVYKWSETKQNYDPYHDKLEEMILCDASLIIIYMEIIARVGVDSSTQHKFSKMKEHLGLLTLGIFVRDLFLLQNQIPLSVINLLIYLRYGPAKAQILLHRFLNNIFPKENGRSEEDVVSQVNRGEPLHLLDAAHRLFVSNFSHRVISPDPIQPEIEMQKPLVSFRSVTDLKRNGIRFKPRPNGSHDYVDFKSYFFYNTIYLPTWVVNVHTKALFMNLVAYELSPNSPTECEMLSYINFMKLLIDGPKDVKELREDKILHNMLGSDKEAADIFNDVQTFGLDNPKFFGQMGNHIQDHYKSRVTTWMADLLESYFRTPWTITAFLVAVTVLAITAAQLYYAAHPPKN